MRHKQGFFEDWRTDMLKFIKLDIFGKRTFGTQTAVYVEEKKHWLVFIHRQCLFQPHTVSQMERQDEGKSDWRSTRTVIYSILRPLKSRGRDPRCLVAVSLNSSVDYFRTKLQSCYERSQIFTMITPKLESPLSVLLVQTIS